MRRRDSGAGAGLVSARGSRKLLVIRGVVGYYGDDVVRVQLVAPPEVAKLYEESHACDCAAGVLDELAHRAGGAACSEEVVGYEDAGTRRYGVGVDLQGVRAV